MRLQKIGCGNNAIDAKERGEKMPLLGHQNTLRGPSFGVELTIGSYSNRPRDA
jgi:hypothetical protein